MGYIASIQQVQGDDKTLWCANDAACAGCFPKGQCRVCKKGHADPTAENGFKCEKIPGWEDPSKPKKKKRKSKKAKKGKNASMLVDAGINLALAACVLGAGYLAFVKLTAKDTKKGGNTRSKAKGAAKRK